MSIKVMVGRPLELTEPQVALLRFFAGELDPRGSTRWRTYAALQAQGVIKEKRNRPGYVITELGHQVLVELERVRNGSSC